ncbi:MAG: hypothetical protein HQK67_01865 [Desulfamplus sp.]|nr:hypothetical protein [Desulfamplus sp.]
MKLTKCFFQRIFFLSMLFVFILTLSAAYAASAKSSFGEDNLRKKVKLYWDKRINADYDGMYELEADVNKKKFKLPEYRKLFGDQLQIVRYSIKDVKIISEKKQANVSIIYAIELKIPIPGLLGHKKELAVDEIWIFEHDNWFHLQ